MKKYQYLLLWLLAFGLFTLLIYYSTALISNTVIANWFLQFEVMLPIIGFSMILSTLIICTILILSKLNEK
ncbi:MAG: hypothetical protein ACRC17_08880 [Culicoidibacterales bacterium]